MRLDYEKIRRVPALMMAYEQSCGTFPPKADLSAKGGEMVQFGYQNGTIHKDNSELFAMPEKICTAGVSPAIMYRGRLAGTY